MQLIREIFYLQALLANSLIFIIVLVFFCEEDKYGGNHESRTGMVRFLKFSHVSRNIEGACVKLSYEYWLVLKGLSSVAKMYLLNTHALYYPCDQFL